MTSAPRLPTGITRAEYLALEAVGERKYELIAGEVFAMSGASRKHNLITLNTASSLHAQLRQRPCEVYQESMHVARLADDFFAYPDVVVVCDEPHFAEELFDTLLNPTLLVEVLSPSTERRDATDKWQHYQQIPSLQHYLMIAQDTVRVQHYQRQSADAWLLQVSTSRETTLTLDAIDCTLSLAEVYAKVSFD